MGFSEAQHGGPRRKLFFLRGHMRSGTNWIGAILNLHPRILCVGEFHFGRVRKAMDDLLARYPVEGGEPWKSVVERAFADLVDAYLQPFGERKPAAEWIGDRTPALVDGPTPGARHIVVERDGRDVIVSRTLHHLRRFTPGVPSEAFHDGPGALHERWVEAPDLFDREPELLLADEGWVRFAAKKWSSMVNETREAARAMEAGERDGSVAFVKYEAVHEDPERERTALYRYLDLDPEEAAPLESGASTEPGKVAADENARKGVVGDWERFFTADAKRWFKDEAGETLIALGYETDNDW